MKEFIWEGEVRTCEIDAQGIVNNAHYLNYFDHARSLQLFESGIDWVKLSHEEGLNLVLAETKLRFLKPLRAFQSFQITSIAKPEGKLRLLFDQALKSNNELMCTAQSIVVCVDLKRNKPVSVERFLSH